MHPTILLCASVRLLQCVRCTHVLPTHHALGCCICCRSTLVQQPTWCFRQCPLIYLSHGAHLILLRLLPRCCRCSSLATAVGVCYEPSHVPSCYIRLHIVFAYVLRSNIAHICDVGCGTKPPPEKNHLLQETFKCKLPQNADFHPLALSTNRHSHRTTYVSRGRHLPPSSVLLGVSASAASLLSVVLSCD